MQIESSHLDRDNEYLPSQEHTTHRCRINISVEGNNVPSSCEDLQIDRQIKTRYGGCGVGSHLDARKHGKIRLVLRVVPSSLLSTIAALVSLLESPTGPFLHSVNCSNS